MMKFSERNLQDTLESLGDLVGSVQFELVNKSSLTGATLLKIGQEEVAGDFNLSLVTGDSLLFKGDQPDVAVTPDENAKLVSIQVRSLANEANRFLEYFHWSATIDATPVEFTLVLDIDQRGFRSGRQDVTPGTDNPRIERTNKGVPFSLQLWLKQ